MPFHPTLGLDPSRLAILIFVLVIPSVILFIVRNYIHLRNRKKPFIDAPILNLGPDKNYIAAAKKYKSHFKDVLQEGYEKFKEGIYQLWGIDGYLVIVSPRYVQELDALGTEVLDMHSASQKVGISLSL